MDAPITKLEASLISLDEELNKVQKRKTDAKQATEKASKDIDELKAEVDEWKSKSEECEKVIDDLKKNCAETTASIGKLKRQISSKETQIEQLKSRKQEILEKCELEQIKLPTISEPMETGLSTSTPNFDYNQLSRSHLQEMRPSEHEKLEMEFKQKMDSLITELERTAPNLKALDQYEALQERERTVTEEFDAAKKQVQVIADKYNSIKQRRQYFSYCLV